MSAILTNSPFKIQAFLHILPLREENDFAKELFAKRQQLTYPPPIKYLVCGFGYSYNLWGFNGFGNFSG